MLAQWCCEALDEVVMFNFLILVFFISLLLVSDRLVRFANGHLLLILVLSCVVLCQMLCDCD